MRDWGEWVGTLFEITGFMVWGSEFTAQGSGMRVQGLAPNSDDGPDVTPRPILYEKSFNLKNFW